LGVEAWGVRSCALATGCGRLDASARFRLPCRQHIHPPGALVAPKQGVLNMPGPRNRWGIAESVAMAVIARDDKCVYCGADFTSPSSTRGSKPSWEHIVNDIRMATPANIALCCISCNASKGTKPLATWLRSDYCKGRNISANSIARVARDALDSQ
jgi:hypothetical protein